MSRGCYLVPASERELYLRAKAICVEDRIAEQRALGVWRNEWLPDRIGVAEKEL